MTVFGGVNNQVEASYLVLLGLGGGLVPRVLSFSEVTDSNWPYLYNGQLISNTQPTNVTHKSYCWTPGPFCLHGKTAALLSRRDKRE